MLLFCDSFDHYSAHEKKYELIEGAPAAIGAFGRFGTNGWPIQGPNSNGALGKSYVGVQKRVIIVGIAFDPRATSGAVIRLHDTVGNGEQLQVYWDPAAAKIRIYRGNGAVLLATSTHTFTQGVYVYLEFKATIDSAAGGGAYSLKVDGAADVSASGVLTRATANAWCDEVFIGPTSGNNSLTGYVDDLYICDDTGAQNNDFLGDVRVQCLLPTGNGATSDFDGSDGNSVDNYQLVDEAVPNDDTDYVESATPGDIDTYAYGNLAPTTGAVLGVQSLLYARKDDAGTRTIAPVIRQGVTDYPGTNHNIGATYGYYTDVTELNPATGLPFTVTEVNADEFGVKEIA